MGAVKLYQCIDTRVLRHQFCILLVNKSIIYVDYMHMCLLCKEWITFVNNISTLGYV